jgi:hypothetical protein
MTFSQKHGDTSSKYKTKPWWQFGTKVTEQVLTLREGQHLVSISGTYKADKIGKPVLIRHVQFTDNSKRVHGPYGNVIATNADAPAEGVNVRPEQLVAGFKFKFTPGDDGIIRSFRGHDAAIGLAAVGVNYSLACKQHDVVASSSSSNNNNATSTTTPSTTATAATTAAAPPSATSSDEVTASVAIPATITPADTTATTTADETTADSNITRDTNTR